MNFTNEAIREELVDRSESKAGDWSGCVLRANNFQEGSEKHVGLHFREV